MTPSGNGPNNGKNHSGDTMSENVLTNVSTPNQLRAELEAMVLGDLLGPAGGESEELIERNVRDRYLVGVLA